MKTSFLKFYITALTLLISFTGFAQIDPPVDDDPVGAPINSQLIWLAVAGIAFALFFFRKKIQLNK